MVGDRGRELKFKMGGVQFCPLIGQSASSIWCNSARHEFVSFAMLLGY